MCQSGWKNSVWVGWCCWEGNKAGLLCWESGILSFLHRLYNFEIDGHGEISKGFCDRIIEKVEKIQSEGSSCCMCISELCQSGAGGFTRDRNTDCSGCRKFSEFSDFHGNKVGWV